jgi:hypothetical protein
MPSTSPPRFRFFPLVLSLGIVAIVAAGFGPNLDRRLLHPPVARPWLLSVHAVIFTAWVLFFVVQTALVGVRNVRLHRALGWWGAGLGLCVPILGVATAIVVGRVDPHPSDDAAAFLSVSFYDMLAFAIAFGLAVYWRRKPQLHRRLMLIATCGLTSAAIARLLPESAPAGAFYAGVDALILLCVAVDLLETKRLHEVYRWAVPAIVAGQALALFVSLTEAPVWLAFAHRLIG